MADKAPHLAPYRFKKGEVQERRPKHRKAAQAYIGHTTDVVSPQCFKNHVLLMQYRMVQCLGGKVTKEGFSEVDPEANPSLSQIKTGLKAFEMLSQLIIPRGLAEYIKAMDEDEELSLKEVREKLREIRETAEEFEKLKKMGLVEEPQEAEFEEVEEGSSS